MIPEHFVTTVDRVVLAHSNEEHPFHLAHSRRAAENWSGELRLRPMLFDGPVMLASSASIEGGVLSATCHLVPYSTFLLWRKMRPPEGSQHVFAMALPVGADGAVLAVRMAPHTANAGRVYCASGSFDRDDITGGRFDADANMAREVTEETGLDLGEAEAEPVYHVLAMGGVVVIVRVYRFAASAAELAKRVEAHIASQPEPELAGALAVSGVHEVTPQFAAHMAPILAWHFARG